MPLIYCKKQTKPIKKILIIRPDAIGDLILITPALHALRQKFPQAKISVLIQNYTRAVLEGNPDIDEILIDEIKEGKVKNIIQYLGYLKKIKAMQFDLCVNYYNDTAAYSFLPYLAGIPYRISDQSRILVGWLSNLGTFLNHADPNKHVVERNLDLLAPLNIKISDPQLRLEVNQATRENFNQKPTAIIHIGTGGSNKAWTGEGYAKVTQALQNQLGLQVVFIGTKKEAEKAKQIMALCQKGPIDLTEKLTLRELIALIKTAKIFIGTDSGPLHIAAALKIPTVAIFASKFVKPSQWGPWDTPNIIIKKDSACQRKCEPRNCSYDDCLKEIAPEEVVAAVETLLKKESRKY